MTVETPERDWTDSRLDDLKQAVDDGNKKMDAGFSELRGEMKAGFTKVDERFEKIYERMDAGFARLDSRFYRLMLVLVAALLGIIGTLIAVLLS